MSNRDHSTLLAASMPEDGSFLDLAQELVVMAAIQAGRDSLARGERYTYDEVLAEIESWPNV